MDTARRVRQAEVVGTQATGGALTRNRIKTHRSHQRRAVSGASAERESGDSISVRVALVAVQRDEQDAVRRQRPRGQLFTAAAPPGCVNDLKAEQGEEQD